MLDWLSGLSDMASQMGAEIWAFLSALLNLLVQVFQFLWSVLQAVANFLWGLLQKVGGFFKTLWKGIVHKVLDPLFRAFIKIHDWLEAKLGPVLRFLKKIRNYVDRVFRIYIKPILQMISAVRKVLELLRLFGVKWAAKLDKLLAKVQADIANVFLQIRSILNGVIDLVNLIIDPLALVRKPTLVLSGRRTINSIIRLSTGRPVGFFMPSPRGNAGFGQGQVNENISIHNPITNPPPSFYFGGDDGLGGFNGFVSGSTPADTSVDQADMLDYFNDDLYNMPTCTDPVSCAQQAWTQQLGSSVTQF